MKNVLKIIAIIILATIGIVLLKGYQILSLNDYIGLWCITAVGWITSTFDDA